MGGGMGGSSGGGMGGGGSQSGQGGQGGQGGVAPSFTRSTSIILVGPKSEVKSAIEAMEQMDVPQPIVRIDASLVELSKDAIKELGVNWSWRDGNFSFAQSKSGTAEVNSSSRQISGFSAKLTALINNKKAQMLANPNISCVDNEDASIFIGELRRFRGSTIVTPGIGTVQGTETVPVGVALLVRPRIHPDGNITLKVHPVVSTVTSLVDGLPQTASREADTTVRLREGEELVIGGLYRTEITESVDKIPLLGDLPLIGDLFRTRSHSKGQSEVVVVLRAYPVLTEPAPAKEFGKGTLAR
jgi:type II secretory pathway component GspD/PulD (secretin)